MAKLNKNEPPTVAAPVANAIRLPGDAGTVFRDSQARAKNAGKAAALAFYAKQRDDHELNVWMSEIKVRASRRIGELGRDLDTAQGMRSELSPTARTKLKDTAIAEAGLSRTTAYELQEQAGYMPENPLAELSKSE